ncbi:EthD family reductase [Bacillus kwashiorkori]|uniref:EthD family reductase n=1 Tax=Bacillus kwashiorkori TaxID=1522318 RepID=UPI0007854E59|nr:EthD family reductase [Bacillus kwashiorkori]
MFKMIALFKKPEDITSFDEYYFGTHIPLTKKIPGLVDLKVTKFTGAPGGESKYYLMCEMYYESKESFKEASKTPESKASGKDVMKFAGNLVTFMFGEEVNG